MRVRKVLIFNLLIWIPGLLLSQYGYYEIGAGVGIANYSGDMSNDKLEAVFRTATPTAMGYVRYNLTPNINFKGSLLYARLTGNDAIAESPALVNRNLSFFTNVIETGFTTEINILKYDPIERGSLFTVYLMGGVAGFYFDPRTTLDGRTYRLRPLGTEGQGLPEYPNRELYALYQLAIPFGGGLKIRINDLLNLNAELGWRMTFTDYLDDVSTTYPAYNALFRERGEIATDLSVRALDLQDPGQYDGSVRGNPEIDDYYFTFHVGVSYNIVNYGSVGGKRRRINTSKCPKF